MQIERRGSGVPGSEREEVRGELQVWAPDEEVQVSSDAASMQIAGGKASELASSGVERIAGASAWLLLALGVAAST